jgi:gluconolactonase
MAKLDNTRITVIAKDLAYPEGPIYCSDGSILLVEIKGECLTRIRPDHAREVVAKIPGGPNGAAFGPGPQGAPQIYICNDGGFNWLPHPLPSDPPKPGYKPQLWISATQPADYTVGKLQKVDPLTGALTDLFFETAQTPCWPEPPLTPEVWEPPFLLRGPDDLVVDDEGGIWLTDFGKQRNRDKDITGVYYVSPDGSGMRQAIYPLNSPNGIALSPDGKWLYVALSYERRVLKYEVGPGGTFKPNPRTLDGSYLVTGDFVGCSVLDSMAVDSAGNLYVATMVPQGNDPEISGGITVISPGGEFEPEFIPIRMPDGESVPLPSNICFGGEDMKTAYITCGGSGYLISMPASIPGHKLNFSR